MTFTDFLIDRGWEFFQDSPDSGKWFKFNKDGDAVHAQGDGEWRHMWHLWRIWYR